MFTALLQMFFPSPLKPALIRIPLAALFLLMPLLSFSAPVAQAATLDAAEAALLAEINTFRSNRGLARVVASDSLTVAAKWMATDMAVNNYFSHTSLDGRSPFQRMSDVGYPVSQAYTGENLAAGYTAAATVLNGWLNSPKHLEVLLNPNYRAVGIGRAYSAGSSYQWYWAADFGSIFDAPSTVAVRSVDLGFHASYHGQSPNLTLAPGATGSMVVALKNTGYRGWYQGSPGQQANLGTSSPLDSARPDVASNWLSLSRPATTTTAYVGPGQVGWFTFNVKAPSASGVYRVHVRGVIDGTTWMEDPGIFFTITVP